MLIFHENRFSDTNFTKILSLQENYYQIHDEFIFCIITQQTRGIHPMLFQCWASVEDGVPTLKQLWVNAPCLLSI